MSFIRQIKRNGRIYLAEVENKRDGKKVIQKTIRYIGLSPDQNKSRFPQNLDELEIDGIRVYGSLLSLNFLAKELGLYEILGEYAGPILSLVFCHCHDYRSIAKTSKWFKNTDLSQIMGMKEMSDNRLRQAIEGLAMQDLTNIQKSIFQNIITLCDQNISSVLYDVTNTYFTGKNCYDAKKGLDKEGVHDRLLIQIGLAITNNHGFPIFHQTHRGNVHDSKIFSESINYLKIFGLHKGVIIHDRGMTSKDNVFKLLNQNWKVIAGVSLHAGIKKIITKMDFLVLTNYRNRVTQGGGIFYIVSKKYKLGEVNGRLLILLDTLKQRDQKEDRLKGVIELQKKIKTNPESTSHFKKYLDKNGKINAHAIKRAEKFDGISCIFTNGNYSVQQTVNLYFGRGLIEAAFRSMKSSLALRPVRVWLQAHVEVHLLICHLAYALLTTFRFFINKARGKPGFSQLNGISAEEALDELTQIYRVYFHKAGTPINPEDPPLSKLVTLSKRQETILKAISPSLLKL